MPELVQKIARVYHPDEEDPRLGVAPAAIIDVLSDTFRDLGRSMSWGPMVFIGRMKVGRLLRLQNMLRRLSSAVTWAWRFVAQHPGAIPFTSVGFEVVKDVGQTRALSIFYSKLGERLILAYNPGARVWRTWTMDEIRLREMINVHLLIGDTMRVDSADLVKGIASGGVPDSIRLKLLSQWATGSREEVHHAGTLLTSVETQEILDRVQEFAADQLRPGAVLPEGLQDKVTAWLGELEVRLAARPDRDLEVGSVSSKENLKKLFDYVEFVLGKLPANTPGISDIKEGLKRWREILLEARSPRLALIGRTGSGKSTLINGLLGRYAVSVAHTRSADSKEWCTLEGDTGTIELLDTRGVGEGRKPEGAEYETPQQAIRVALEERQADALLFVCKAKDRAHTKEDVVYVAEVRRIIQAKFKYQAPTIIVVSQVDELEPPRAHPSAPKKMEHIRDCCRRVQEEFDREGQSYLDTVPVCAYVEFDASGKITEDARWNMDTLQNLLIKQLPKSAVLEMAKVGQLKAVQAEIADEMILATAVMAAGLAAMPIPTVTVAITSIQTMMVMVIGYIGGREISKETALEFMGAIGVVAPAGLVFRELARWLVSLLPGVGTPLAAGVAYGATLGVGKAAKAYFIDRVSKEQAKKVFDESQAKGERVPDSALDEARHVGGM